MGPTGYPAFAERRFRKRYRYGGADHSAPAVWALDPQSSVESSEPVTQPDQPMAVDLSAADPIVAHLDVKNAIVPSRDHDGLPGVRVLGDIGQRLGHDEVRGRLHHLRQSTHPHVHLNRDRHSRSQRLDPRVESPKGEGRREDAVRELAQLVGRSPRVLERLVDQRGGVLTSLLVRTLSMLQRDHGVHEPLLRSVVQVAHHAPTLLVARDHDPCPRCRQIGPCLHVGDRCRHQLGELAKAGLGIRRQRRPLASSRFVQPPRAGPQ